MSITIAPYATASGLERSTGDKKVGIDLNIKYLQVGKGHQTIKLDDSGHAITEKLADPVGYIELLSAKKVNPYQWQMAGDLRRLKDVNWSFTEFAACDANKKTVAIYGSKNQTITHITPYLDNALLGLNLIFATFPANSVTIEHHNLPLTLFFDEEFAAITAAIISNTTSIIKLGGDVEKTNKLLIKKINELGRQRKDDLEIITSAIISNATSTVKLGGEIEKTNKFISGKVNKLEEQRKVNLEIIISSIISNNTSVVKLGHVMKKNEKRHQDQFNQLSALYINSLTDQVNTMGLL